MKKILQCLLKIDKTSTSVGLDRIFFFFFARIPSGQQLGQCNRLEIHQVKWSSSHRQYNSKDVSLLIKKNNSSPPKFNSFFSRGRNCEISLNFDSYFCISCLVVKTTVKLMNLIKDFMFHIAVPVCIDKVSSVSLFLSVHLDISWQYYGSRATQCRRPAVHCALHPFITFQTCNNGQTQREREKKEVVSWEDDSNNLYVCVLRPWCEFTFLTFSIVKILWKRMSSVLTEVATTTQSWHTCAHSLAEDKK